MLVALLGQSAETGIFRNSNVNTMAAVAQVPCTLQDDVSLSSTSKDFYLDHTRFKK